jgi:hypothetical protein
MLALESLVVLPGKLEEAPAQGLHPRLVEQLLLADLRTERVDGLQGMDEVGPCLSLVDECGVARRTASRAICTAGISRPIKTAMTAMTTKSSISVKPGRFVGRDSDLMAWLPLLGA